MLARVTRLKMTPERAKQTAAYFSEAELADAVTDLHGSNGAYLLIDREAGKAIAVTFWERAEDMADSRDFARQISGNAGTDGISVEGTPEVYEVLEIIEPQL